MADRYAIIIIIIIIVFLSNISMLFVTCTTSLNNNKHYCNISSSCGDIVNISYPFRLKGQPENCGEPLYELSCENNITILYLNNSKYHVKAIKREYYTIQVLDPNITESNCSVLDLQKQMPDGNQTYPYKWVFSTIAVVSCKYPVNSDNYIDISSCNTSSFGTVNQYSYTLVNALPSDVEYGCSVGKIGYMETSYDQLDRGIKLVSQGVDLYWDPIYCQDCKGDYCYFRNDDYSEFSCDYSYHYHYHCGFQCFIYSLLYLLKDSLTHIPEVISDNRGFSKNWENTHGEIENINSIRIVYAKEFVIFPTLFLLLVTATKCVIGSPFVAAFLVYKWRRRHLSMYDKIEDFLQRHSNLLPIRYSSSQIRKMTKAFNHELGKGGYGSVYKGTLRSGRTVAVKVLGKSKKTNGQDFINEVATIGRIHHVNVVQLIGFCADRSTRALVYDFMPNGSLEKYLFSKEIGDSILSYETMYRVSLGVARGIEYLHRGCEIQILHFDIKPHNILLDENFVPKLSDFGLAKLYPTENSIVTLTAARGTMGYMAPELFYKNIGGVSYKADVYSFGMLLMEMAGRRRNLNAYAENPSQIYFPSWAYEQIKDDKEIEMESESDKELVKKMMITALWCIQMKPVDRPSMHKVVEMLQADFQTIPIPPKPFVTPREAAEKND